MRLIRESGGVDTVKVSMLAGDGVIVTARIDAVNSERLLAAQKRARKSLLLQFAKLKPGTADNHAALSFFDPQFRELLERQSYGNEGEQRQSTRAALPAMSPDYIDAVVRELARVLKPSGYLMRWCDKYALCEAHHLRIPAELLKIADLIVTDNARMGMGYRTRTRGEFLLVAQEPPIKARATWRDHAIPDRWIEKVNRSVHPHMKPIGLIKRLIGAVTMPGELIVDPAAGSFTTMHAALALGRQFVGVDIAFNGGVAHA